MNAGKPVIVSSDVGSGPDLVRDGVNGFIIPVGDIAGMADALVQILGDDGLARRMGAASLDRITEWGFARNVAGLIAACRSLGFDPGKADGPSPSD